ncbi:MAG: ATP-binding protein [Lutibacter sp.]|nr:ATP-binding protein [Lutibacter sp.]
MINKRLLIKNLLAHNDENSFYDKKLKISLDHKEGKAKFLKLVCALSNSNPENNSYIVIGVEDQYNKIEGVDFFDDSKIQNLMNSYFNNPPKIQYENIAFPSLPRYKVVGLVTINPTKKIASLKKNIWKYVNGTIFYRRGSTTLSTLDTFEITESNKGVVEAIEKMASNNIQLTLDGVFDFMNRHKKAYNPTYKVFNEQFVLCWAGEKRVAKGATFYSRVDIELINEQVRLFYSALDDVKIEFDNNSFRITEFVYLGLKKSFDYYSLEKTVIHFKENGKYDIASELLFEPPQFDKKLLHHVFNNYNAILEKLKKNLPLTESELADVHEMPTYFLICILNNIPNAFIRLKESELPLKNLEDKTGYIKYKEAIRILRKVKYS